MLDKSMSDFKSWLRPNRAWNAMKNYDGSAGQVVILR